MRSFAVAVVFAALAGLSNTQTIDPDSVPISTRENWCLSQTTSCPLLCLQFPGNSATTVSNDCDAATLTYSCVCENGLSPNSSEYTQTIPFYICQEYGNQCVTACGSDNTCADNCRTQHPCGAQDPVRVNSTTITTMPATTSSAATKTGDSSAMYTGFGGTAATTAASNKNAAGALALEFGQAYGLATVFIGLFAGFALVL